MTTPHGSQVYNSHCEHVSPGCERYYAESDNHRCRPNNGTGLPYDRRARDLVDCFVDKKKLREPLHWKSPKKIFVENQSDLFGEWVPDEAIDHVFAVMALCSQHSFQVLTKRPERMFSYLSENSGHQARRRVQDVLDPVIPNADRIVDLKTGYRVALRLHDGWPLFNVWLGVSIENREHNSRIDFLRDTPATLRFLSLEPVLEDLGELDLRGIDWVIVGGESGTGARPFEIAWARDTIAECMIARVPCFVKQLGANPIDRNLGLDDWKNGALDAVGAWHPILLDRKGGDPSEWPEDLRVRQFPKEALGACLVDPKRSAAIARARDEQAKGASA